MSTPHNSAEKGQFAKTVLMPGDPLRAKFIAETFLENPVLVNNVRGIQGYTGTWKGKPVSVMASGMGMPSIGIYSYELFKEYDVENIIRIGSAGAYVPDLKMFDVVLASAAYSESSYAKVQSGYEDCFGYPSKALNEKLLKAAKDLEIPVKEGVIHSSDVFYRENHDGGEDPVNDKHCICVEMESFALFNNARVLGKNASCLLTISDSLVSHEATTAEERQTSFTRMMKIALDAAIAD
ncbi:purine nucleoside phosphorylase [Bulleidia extructa W1219]|jgi:purine-nucleoside phosphorylase, family 1 (deoD)|uniref:Uridine phosphorylase n=1 Tax=Bulleidia extructa W1219 TaxID=679192 RepID=D2MND6_9FIRM|nr:purine-nucleoside phosphorylase [Bulleidia extructa]EFC05958.1 purine nucleoside phosphorylase [Bulleidia extructa W1219]